MSDQTADGRALNVADAPVAPAGEPTVEKKPIEGAKPVTQKAGIELVPSYVRQGNELVVIAKMLESINKNLAFLAQSVARLIDEEKK